MKLSAVVISHNEEGNLRQCLQSLAFCDEIVVVDSGSTDGTVAIAGEFTDRVFTRAWDGYVSQRNFAASQASHDWILSVDADEVVPDDLRDEILTLLAANPSETAFSVPRKTIHLGRWIRHGGWYPNRIVRLFRKSRGKWSGGDVHEFWETTGTAGELTRDLLHYSFDDLADQVSRNNLYSTLGAVDLLRAGRTAGLFRMMIKPLSKFIETYFLKRGFLDGFPGFIISVSAAYSVFLKWAKLWELESRHGEH